MLVTMNEFTDDIKQIIINKQNEKPITKLNSYNKDDIDEFYKYTLEKLSKYITDDYYDQDYIDSFYNKSKQLLDKFKDCDVYTKSVFDSTINTIKLLLVLKQTKNDTIIDNDWVNYTLSQLNTYSIDIYTKEQIDLIMNQYLFKDLVGSEIISCEMANELYNKVQELEELYKEHLNAICRALTKKGIDTPENSSIYLICANIAQLNPSGTDLRKSYSLVKLLDLESSSYKVCSDSNANMYISYNDKICVYSGDGILLKTITKSVSGNTVGIFEERYSNQYMYIIDDNRYFMLLNKSTLSIEYSNTLKLNKSQYTGNITRVCYKPNLSSMDASTLSSSDYKKYAYGYLFIVDDINNVLYSLEEKELFSNLSNTTSYPNMSNSYTNIGMDTFSITTNHKLYPNSALLYRYINNNLSIFPMGQNSSFITTFTLNCSNIQCLCMNNMEEFIVCADNKIYTLDLLYQLDKVLYTCTNDVNAITNISSHVIHVLENHNKVISIDIRDTSKTVVTDLDVDINDFYTDSLNRVICFADNSLYKLIEKE